MWSLWTRSVVVLQVPANGREPQRPGRDSNLSESESHSQARGKRPAIFTVTLHHSDQLCNCGKYSESLISPPPYTKNPCRASDLRAVCSQGGTDTTDTESRIIREQTGAIPVDRPTAVWSPRAIICPHGRSVLIKISDRIMQRARYSRFVMQGRWELVTSTKRLHGSKTPLNGCSHEHDLRHFQHHS